MTNTAPPTFDGEPRVGRTLTPHVGTWTGGWGDERSLLGMRACPTAAAEDCRAMTASSWQPGNPEHLTVDPAYAGWYVGATEARIGSGSVFPAIGYVFTPGQVSLLRAPTPGQTVAAGPLSGPIVGARSTQPAGPTARLRFTPRVTIRKRAVRRGGALVLAARCAVPAAASRTRPCATGAGRLPVASSSPADRRWSGCGPGTFSRRATIVRVSVRFDRHAASSSGSVKPR